MRDLAAVPQSSVQIAARQALEGRRRGLKALLPFVGPAFIASVAYIDPGNYATNIQSGAEFGYHLLWVVLLANVMAMLFQNLSAKLGIATGANLPELCRREFARPVSVGMWVVSEVAAMATDLAEFLGATLALNLLLGIPMIVATLVTGVLTYLLLSLDRYGFRALEAAIGVLVAVIALSYLVETGFSHPAWGQVAVHAVVPWLQGPKSVLLTVGIIGATIMPHAVYLHSGLMQDRVPARTAREKRRVHHFELLDVVIAMSLAGLINMAMLYMSAAVFHQGHSGVADITGAYRTLMPLLGDGAAFVFLISLLASGLSSSTVGTMAGQVIMQGFVGFRIPVWIRRLVTMVPTVIVVALGVDPTMTLVISQVILSLVLPLPMIAVVKFTARRDLMGELVNSRLTTAVAVGATGFVLLLNLVLLWQTAGLPLPILG
jgi:manganese transport protein